MKETLDSSQDQDAARLQEANRACAIALLFMSAAIFCLTVGVFSVSPESPLGIIFVCLGLAAMIGCIIFFARYNALSK